MLGNIAGRASINWNAKGRHQGPTGLEDIGATIVFFKYDGTSEGDNSTHVVVAFTGSIMALSVRRIARLTTQGDVDEALVHGGTSGAKELAWWRR
jgi:hypothetical protein